MIGNITLLVIAHRLSSIKKADMIYVLNEGNVVERGKYDDLLQIKGNFSLMVQNQSLQTT